MKLRNDVLGALVALALPLTGQASEHWYVNAKLGWGDGLSACEDQASSCDPKSTGKGIFVGYQLREWLALEGGYHDLGNITSSYPALGHPDVSADYEGEMSGVELVAKPFWQLNENITLFAKVGTLAWNMDVTGDEVDFEHKASDEGWSPLLGAGVEYAFNRHWSTLLEYQWINDVGGSSTGGTDVGTLNLGVSYHFVSEDEVPLPAPAPAPAPVAAAVPQNTKPQQWSFHGAPFASASSELTPELQQALQPAIQHLRTYPQANVIISTHTDSQGSAEFNQQLSDQRAQAILDYFLAQGAAPEQVVAQGYGEASPIADNRTEAGRDQNRRVEVVLPLFEATTESVVGEEM